MKGTGSYQVHKKYKPTENKIITQFFFTWLTHGISVWKWHCPA